MSSLMDKWNKYLSEVPGIKELVSVDYATPDDSFTAYRLCVEELPDCEVDSDFAAFPNDTEEYKSQLIQHQWCMCEMPEGDFPRTFAYPTLKGLTDAVLRREGQETAVYLLYGVPLQLTRAVGGTDYCAKVRYILLPNQKAAVVSANMPFKVIDQSELPDGIEVQDEGWLGNSDMVSDQSYYINGFIDTEHFSADPEDDDKDDNQQVL